MGCVRNVAGERTVQRDDHARQTPILWKSQWTMPEGCADHTAEGYPGVICQEYVEDMMKIGDGGESATIYSCLLGIHTSHGLCANSYRAMLVVRDVISVIMPIGWLPPS